MRIAKRAVYGALRASNDLSAARHHRVGRRIGRRVYGKVTGRIARKLFG